MYQSTCRFRYNYACLYVCPNVFLLFTSFTRSLAIYFLILLRLSYLRHSFILVFLLSLTEIPLLLTKNLFHILLLLHLHLLLLCLLLLLSFLLLMLLAKKLLLSPFDTGFLFSRAQSRMLFSFTFLACISAFFCFFLLFCHGCFLALLFRLHLCFFTIFFYLSFSLPSLQSWTVFPFVLLALLY